MQKGFTHLSGSLIDQAVSPASGVLSLAALAALGDLDLAIEAAEVMTLQGMQWCQRRTFMAGVGVCILTGC